MLPKPGKCKRNSFPRKNFRDGAKVRDSRRAGGGRRANNNLSGLFLQPGAADSEMVDVSSHRKKWRLHPGLATFRPGQPSVRPFPSPSRCGHVWVMCESRDYFMISEGATAAGPAGRTAGAAQWGKHPVAPPALPG